VNPDGARVAFELDRFELMGEDRLEIAGRWFGVRGLRFVRPSLTVRTEEGERNLLALLEHKPWAAEEGRSWIAAFPWEGGSPDPGQAELAVAPSVVVALAREGAAQASGVTADRRPSLRERLSDEQQRARRLGSEVAWLREEREALIADKERAAAECERLADELAAAQMDREEAIGRLEAALRERDQMSEERDAALRSRDLAERERDGAVRRREAELAQRADVAAERDRALKERDAALREHDLAASDRAKLVRARDEAVKARAVALAERDAALGRGSGFPAVSAADLARQPHSPSASGGRDGRTARAIAVGALIALLLILIALLKFL
jgi:hypothetical protein